MSDQIATTPLSGPVEYDFGAQTPDDWPRLYVSKDDHIAEKLRWVRSLTQICSYCGWEAKAGGGSWSELQEHIHSCPEHPIRKLKAALREAQEWNWFDPAEIPGEVHQMMLDAMTPVDGDSKHE